MMITDYLSAHIAWDLMLIMLAVLYLLARHILRRHGDGAGLLKPATFRYALVGWIASLAAEIVRWLVVTPLRQENVEYYIEHLVFGSSEAYTSAARWFAVLRWGVVAVTVVLMALAERKKAAEAPQQTENAGEMK